MLEAAKAGDHALLVAATGAGKTLAGASWIAEMAERLGPGGRLALIGATLHDVREVMIEGTCGSTPCADPRRVQTRCPRPGPIL